MDQSDSTSQKSGPRSLDSSISEPQAVRSLFDAMIILILLVFWTIIPIYYYDGSNSSSDFFIGFMLLFDVIALTFVLDVLVFAKITVDSEAVSSEGILSALKKRILLSEVAVFYLRDFPIFPAVFPMFTKRLMFRMKDGTYKSLYCSNEKVIAALFEIAEQGRFRKVDSLSELWRDS